MGDAPARLFFLTLVGLQALRARLGDLDDATLLLAVAALRKTVETRAKGVLYEHAPEGLQAQNVLRELRGFYEAKDEQGRPVAPSDADLLPALASLEAALAETRKENAGPTAFLDTGARLVAREGGGGAREQPARPLIVEP